MEEERKPGGLGGRGQNARYGTSLGGRRFGAHYSFPPIRETPLYDGQPVSVLICLRERFFVNITVYML